MRKRLLTIAFAAAFALAPIVARAQIVVYDPSAHMQQLLIQANTYSSYINEARTAAIEAQQILKSPGSYTNQAAQLAALTSGLATQIGNTALTSQKAQAAFIAQHPGYAPSASQAATDKANQVAFQQSLGSLLGGLNVAQSYLQHAAQQNLTITTMQTKNEAAPGALAAQQTANNIAIESLKEMQAAAATQASMMAGLLQDAATRSQLDATDRANAAAYIKQYTPQTGQTKIWF